MTLVAGVDSSTQSCKVVVRDADTGALVRHGSARHPDGTEVDPVHWEHALQSAIAAESGRFTNVTFVAELGALRERQRIGMNQRIAENDIGLREQTRGTHGQQVGRSRPRTAPRRSTTSSSSRARSCWCSTTNR